MSPALVDLDATDDAPAVQALFVSLKAAVPELEKLLEECSSEWGYEDPIYRFYHQSFKGLRARARHQADRFSVAGASAGATTQ